MQSYVNPYLRTTAQYQPPQQQGQLSKLKQTAQVSKVQQFNMIRNSKPFGWKEVSLNLRLSAKVNE